MLMYPQKLRKISSLVLSAFLVLSLIIPIVSAASYKITVFVYEYNTVTPVSGASIYLDGVSKGTTNSEGEKQITGVSQGSHKITVKKSGYEDASQQVSVYSNSQVTVNMKSKLMLEYQTKFVSIDKVAISSDRKVAYFELTWQTPSPNQLWGSDIGEYFITYDFDMVVKPQSGTTIEYFTIIKEIEGKEVEEAGYNVMFFAGTTIIGTISAPAGLILEFAGKLLDFSRNPPPQKIDKLEEKIKIGSGISRTYLLKLVSNKPIQNWQLKFDVFAKFTTQKNPNYSGTMGSQPPINGTLTQNEIIELK